MHRAVSQLNSRILLESFNYIVLYCAFHKLDINAKNQNGRTARFSAAEKGHKVVVRLLLQHTADVNAKDNMGKTTLHYAAWKGHDAVVRLLLEHKAKDNNGWTALHWAAENGQEAVVRLLLRLQIIESMIAHQSSSQRMYYGDKQSGSMSRCLR